MKFRTEIVVAPAPFKITHDSRIMLLGSCFAENVAEKLSACGFTIDLNPFGIVYNPLSIAASLNALIDRKIFTADDLIFRDGLYHSFAHHSRFSAATVDDALHKINSRIEVSAEFLRTADRLIITFGTAWVYRLAATGAVVSNCHKIPENHFRRCRVDVAECVDVMETALGRLKALNPDLKTVFTVSPIRHFRDGFHENSLSKATLLLATEKLSDADAARAYFPSYEIVLDDLRDYRFYADDLAHPSAFAVEYVLDKFADAFFDDKTKTQARDELKKSKVFGHRPLFG